MSQVPNVEDPVLAVLLDRFDRMSKDFAGLRAEVKEDINGLRAEVKQDISDLRTEVAAVKSSQTKFDTLITKAQGGWLVVAGLGAMLTYVVGLWDKVAKLWS